MGFAIAHTIHLGALITYFRVSGDSPATLTLLGGGAAYVLLFLMALTSNDASQRALGRWWKRLHTFGIHTIWFVFAVTYFGRLFDPGRWPQGAVFFPIAIAALALRVAARAKARRPLAA